MGSTHERCSTNDDLTNVRGNGNLLRHESIEDLYGLNGLQKIPNVKEITSMTIFRPT